MIVLGWNDQLGLSDPKPKKQKSNRDENDFSAMVGYQAGTIVPICILGGNPVY